jgi:F0F1-type ATP synthase delta subunit
MDEKQQIKEVLYFIEKAIAEEAEQELERVKQVFAFISTFLELHEQADSKLPYHINVIDELHADENAHSRILFKLLQYKSANSRFEILESFIEYIIEKYPDKTEFKKIKVGSPEITQEKQRIDLWVRDKANGYTIIFENKVNWAADQTEQIARYIDVTKNDGFAEKQIYIIYLSPTYDKDPEEQSWGNYKTNFEDRYLKLSFNEDILFWLKDNVLSNVRLKDVFLRSAIEQYIDHLEGIFEIRTINNKTNMELQEFIKKELELNGTPQENIAKLLAKQEQINKFNNQIELLKKENEKEIFRGWQDSISKKYPDYESVYEEGSRVGLIFTVKDSTAVRVSISFDSQLYCQIDMDIFEGQDLPERIREKTHHLLKRKGDNTQIWQYFPRYDYNGVFNCFKEVMSILTQQK